MSAESNPERAQQLQLLVRVGVFVVAVFVGRWIFPMVIAMLAGRNPNDDAMLLLVTSALSTFATGAFANALIARGWEQGKLSDFGMGWTRRSLRDLFTGIGMAAGAAIIIVLFAVVFQLASFSTTTQTAVTTSASWGLLPLIILVLLLGALGEELIFHGYAFQRLLPFVGDFATVLPAGVLFGIAHLGNQNVTVRAIVNTIAWGVLLGFAYLRTRSLWLPIGLHFGWNLAQPLLGLNLSGFTIGLTGYELRWRAGALWGGGSYGLEGGLLTTFAVIALFAVLPRLVPGLISDSASDVAQERG